MRCKPSRHAFLAGSVVVSFTIDDLKLLSMLQASISRQQTGYHDCEVADRSCIVNAERLWDEHESSQGHGTIANFL